MCHCCAIDSILFTSQYSTKPDGNQKKNIPNITGMIFITLACTGSGGSGLSLVWMIMVAAIRSGRTKYGIDARSKSVLGPMAARVKSSIHSRKGACRSSTLASKRSEERRVGKEGRKRRSSEQ